MNKPARLILSSIVALAALSAYAHAQVNLQPTPAPLVTAENENWYRSGTPIAFAGNIYYPAGPAIHFMGNEMVRTGSYQGIPLYARTTIEPYSVVFVPIAGGLLQPYERRRAGEIAGTSGSSVSSLPAEIPSTLNRSPEAMLQAPAPPVVESAPVFALIPPPPTSAADASARADSAASPRPVATSGRVATSRASTRIARKATPNAIFVEFEHQRWFSSGPPVPLEPRAFTRIGQWHDFPVYAARGGDDSSIYIPIAQGVDSVARYSKHR